MEIDWDVCKHNTHQYCGIQFLFLFLLPLFTYIFRINLLLASKCKAMRESCLNFNFKCKTIKHLFLIYTCFFSSLILLLLLLFLLSVCRFCCLWWYFIFVLVLLRFFFFRIAKTTLNTWKSSIGITPVDNVYISVLYTVCSGFSTSF